MSGVSRHQVSLQSAMIEETTIPPPTLVLARNSTFRNFTVSVPENGVYPRHFIQQVPTLLHICNIVIILAKRILHIPENSFLVSLSASDIVLMVTALFRCEYEPGMKISQCLNTDNPLVAFLLGTSNTASVLSTLAISMDKYIAVQYSLRYHQIVTRGTLVKSIAAIWVSSIFSSGIVSVICVLVDDWKYFHLPHNILWMILSMVLLASAMHIRNIRNGFEKDITHSRRYFRVDAERLSVLRRLKKSIHGVLRLNIATAVLIFIGSMLAIMWQYGGLRGDNTVLCMQRTSSPTQYYTLSL